MATPTTSKQSELVTLRGKWFKERTRLYDRETGLPTVAVLMDDFEQIVHGTSESLVSKTRWRTIGADG